MEKVLRFKSLNLNLCSLSKYRVLSTHILSCPVNSNRVLSCLAMSTPFVPCPIMFTQIVSCPVLFTQIVSCPVLSTFIMSCVVLVLEELVWNAGRVGTKGWEGSGWEGRKSSGVGWERQWSNIGVEW